METVRMVAMRVVAALAARSAPQTLTTQHQQPARIYERPALCLTRLSNDVRWSLGRCCHGITSTTKTFNGDVLR